MLLRCKWMPVELTETQGWRRKVLYVYVYVYSLQHGEERHRLAPNKLIEVLRNSQGWKMELSRGSPMWHSSEDSDLWYTTHVQPASFTRFTSKLGLEPSFEKKLDSNNSFPSKLSEAWSWVLNFSLFLNLKLSKPEAQGRKQWRSYSRSHVLFTNYSPFCFT